MAVAVLDDGAGFSGSPTLFSEAAVTRGLDLAERDGTTVVPWVLVLKGRRVRLYATGHDAGVGGRPRSDTWVEIHTGLLDPAQAGYLWLLISPEALRANGSLPQIIQSSRRFAADLAVRFRERIYDKVVPGLARAVVKAHPPQDRDPEVLYRRTLLLLFRLLFVAYAEDHDLLPWRHNHLYRKKSLKELARELIERHQRDDPFASRATDLWDHVNRLFKAVDLGREDWMVPPYDGGLFTVDPGVNPDGAALYGLEVKDIDLGPALFALLVDTSPDGGIRGPVDFRSLSVREFGTIYEGLLECRLELDPARDEVRVRRGTSGDRKNTGSYFTPSVVVHRLLEDTLDPAVADHLERVRQLVEDGDTAGAARRLFEFRVADPAMGSGHFLVAAVDHLERAFSAFLAKTPLAEVDAELGRLRAAARGALGPLAAHVDITDAQLLRRLIALRCIYGVDRNPLAVELARLSVWIHTFVPGLPLSFLDHNLVCGGSLTGVGTLREADLLQATLPGGRSRRTRSGTGAVQATLVEEQLKLAIEEARPYLEKLAARADTTIDDVKEARRLHDAAREQVRGVEAVCDLLVCAQAGLIDVDPMSATDPTTAARLVATDENREIIDSLAPVHFPLVFPEVFGPDGPGGFDVVVGNPPWAKVKVLTTAEWARYVPGTGLKSLGGTARTKELERLARDHPDIAARIEHRKQQVDRLRAVLNKTRYTTGGGDFDLYVGFAWRFWNHTVATGRIGMVVPDGILTSSSAQKWRDEVLARANLSVTTLINTRGWVFNGVSSNQNIALISLHRTNRALGTIKLAGPFRDRESFEDGRTSEVMLDVPVVDTGTSRLIPNLPGPQAVEVFRRMSRHPVFSHPGRDWYAWPTREFDATNDKKKGVFDPDPTAERPGWWPVYKGESFNLWEPDTGIYYGWIDPEKAQDVLSAKECGRRFTDVAVGHRPPNVLPCERPRIAYRDITSPTATRTVIAALVPPNTVLVNTAPYLVFAEGRDHPAAQAYVLGVMCSVPFDWYARRLVDKHVTQSLLKTFPVPDVPPGIGCVGGWRRSPAPWQRSMTATPTGPTRWGSRWEVSPTRTTTRT